MRPRGLSNGSNIRDADRFSGRVDCRFTGDAWAASPSRGRRFSARFPQERLLAERLLANRLAEVRLPKAWLLDRLGEQLEAEFPCVEVFAGVHA